MGKKILTILRSKNLHLWTYGTYVVVSNKASYIMYKRLIFTNIHVEDITEFVVCFLNIFNAVRCRYAGIYRTQYPASYTHKSLGRTPQFTLPASTGTQTCLLCLSFKSKIPKLFRNNSVFPIFTAYL